MQFTNQRDEFLTRCIPAMSASFLHFDARQSDRSFTPLPFQKLYAHKFMISAVSEPLAAMLSSRWTKNDENIKITTFGFETFSTFINAIYSPAFKFSALNAWKMIPCADFFQVAELKKKAEDYLVHIFSSNNQGQKTFDFATNPFGKIFNFWVQMETYGLAKLKALLLPISTNGLQAFLVSDQFVNLPKNKVAFILNFRDLRRFVTENAFFEGV